MEIKEKIEKKISKADSCCRATDRIKIHNDILNNDVPKLLELAEAAEVVYDLIDVLEDSNSDITDVTQHTNEIYHLMEALNDLKR